MLTPFRRQTLSRNTPTAAAILVAVAALSLSACASSGGSAQPDPTPAPAPAPATTGVVHGRALDATGTGVAGVQVAVCDPSNCKPTTKIATTGANGSYAIAAPTGRYLEVCVASTTCQIATTPAQRSVTFTLAANGMQVDLITGSTAGGQGSDGAGGSDGTGGSSGGTATDPNAMTGNVYDANTGKLISGVAVEFRKTACPDCLPQPHTTSDGHGHYEISLEPGVYGAECVVPSLAIECGPQGGSGGPFPVTIPGTGHLNFVLCAVNQYPACLKSSKVPRD